MKREILIYFTILIIVAPLMHQEKLIDNFFKALEHPEKFGHIFIYVALIYLVVLIIRFIIREIIRFVKLKIRKSSEE